MSLITVKICLALILHFVADFVFQSDEIAINKSKCNKTLALHCLIYSVFFLAFGPLFTLLVFISHFITDYFTSRINAFLYTTSRHYFFVAIGADQLIHQLTLIGLLCYLH